MPTSRFSVLRRSMMFIHLPPVAVIDFGKAGVMEPFHAGCLIESGVQRTLPRLLILILKRGFLCKIGNEGKRDMETKRIF